MAAKMTDFEIINNKSGKAEIWKHFGFVKRNEIVDKKVIACKLCFNTFKYSGNTTNLTDHIRRKHSTIYDLKTTQSTVTNTNTGSLSSFFGSKASKLPHTSTRAINITSSITQFIVKDLRPFSVVENSGFRNLLQVLEPKYTIPSRQTFSDKKVPELYNKVCIDVKNDVRGNFVSLTTDGWTSRSTESYITITSCHINEDWLIKSYVLQVIKLKVISQK